MERNLISLKNVTKIHQESTVRGWINSIFGKLVSKASTDKIAVNNVSLVINSGERVGIVGENGAGKTTLLELIGGISTPTWGSVTVSGPVTSVFNLGAGLQEELSGLQNIRSMAMLRGIPAADIKSFVDEVVGFADIGPYIEQPMRTYSSGMKARLSFALATARPESILLIDEALSVGDAAFTANAAAKMKTISSTGRTVILVSHDIKSLVETCTRMIWLRSGSIVLDGDPTEVAQQYIDFVRGKRQKDLERWIDNNIQTQSDAAPAITSLLVSNDAFSPESVIRHGKPLQIVLQVRGMQQFVDAEVEITIERSDGLLFDSGRKIFKKISDPATIEVSLPCLSYGSGIYIVTAKLRTPTSHEIKSVRQTVFEVQNDTQNIQEVVCYPRESWQIKPLESH